jgi:RNA polymerase sigma-70 factor (ECF subfamily)
MQRINQGGGSGSEDARLHGLLARGLEGDEAAYHAFLSGLTVRLRAFLRRRLTRAPEEVEDLLQEILLAVHNQRHTYDPSQPLTAWLHAIAKYKLIDCLRRRSRRELLQDPLDDAPELLATADSEAGEARRDLAKLLQALPPRQRLPIECVKLQGLSVAEAAQQLRMSESAVKVGVHRGLKVLAARIRGAS